MLSSEQTKALIVAAIRINSLTSIEPELTEIQKVQLAALETDITTLKSFIKSFRGVNNFLKFGPEQVPENIAASLLNIQKFIGNTTQENAETLNTPQRNYLKEKLFPFEQVIELYQTEDKFRDEMNKVDVERLIRIGQHHMPKFFKQHPLFAEFLREAYRYNNPLTLSLGAFFDNDTNANLDKALELLIQQLKSDAAIENIGKLSLVAANLTLLTDFCQQLRGKVKSDDQTFIDGLGMELIKPVQRGPRIELFLAELLNKSGHNPTVYEELKNQLRSINLLPDILAKHPNVASNYKRLSIIHEAHVKLRADLVTKLNEKIDLVQVEIEHAKMNALLSKNPESNKMRTQWAGLQALLVQTEALKSKYENLKISDKIPVLSSEIKECVKQVRKDHPGFKLPGEVSKMPKRIAQFDKALHKEIAGVRVIENQAQLDVVQKMQLDLLDVIIKKLESAQSRMSNKITDRIDHGKTLSKSLLANNISFEKLIVKFNDIKKDIIENPQVVYTQKSALSRKINAVIEKEKNASPLLAAGFFNKNARLFKEIEKKSESFVRNHVNRVIENPEEALKGFKCK